MKHLAPLLACALMLPAAASAAQPAEPGFSAPSRVDGARAGDRPCLSEREMQAVVTWLVPDAIDGLARKCRGRLTGRAFLPASGAALANRYREDAGAAADEGRRALRRIAGDTPLSLFGDDFTSALIVEGALDRIDPEDCGTADRMVALLSPLPLSSLGEITALLVASGLRNNRGKPAPVQLCKAMIQ
ncbi:MAG: hypothetical protein JWM75_1468 [Sphingomonas bacterium]|nr:hypothetical protein [Sphingomonas bacterium]